MDGLREIDEADDAEDAAGRGDAGGTGGTGDPAPVAATGGATAGGAPGSAAPADAGAFDARVRLFGAAYRMLGSACEAEDVVRDAFAALGAGAIPGLIPGPTAGPGAGADSVAGLVAGAAPRLGAGQPAAPGAAGDPYTWLVRKVVGSAVRLAEAASRGRREGHAGPWLPEPVLTEGGVLGVLGALETAEGRESVSMARLVRLERLPPRERAAYVLREVFGYGPAQTAAVLGPGLTEARCGSLQRRARQRVGGGEGAARTEEGERQRRRTVEELLRAAAEEDRPALEELLADDVVAWSDAGGQPGAVRRPVLGVVKVGRFLAGLLPKAPEGAHGCVAEVNGDAAVVATVGSEVAGVLVPEFGTQGLVGVRMVADPARLVFLNRQWAARPPSGAGWPAHR